VTGGAPRGRALAPLLALLAFAGAALAARPAAADLIVENSDDNPPGERFHSPQHFAFQLTFGPYTPAIDSEFADRSGRQPYKDFFGSSSRLMTQAEFDVELYHGFGTAAVGLGVGYFRATGSAPINDHSGNLSGDQSALTIVPITLSAIYRFDYFLQQANFPLVPYAKLGVNWAYWQITNGNGDIAEDGHGGVGQGGTSGWHAVIGIAFVLDMLDPEAARQFDNEMGVNHSALVFEFGHYDISGLAMSDRLHVGDNTWSAGLMFEF
jgi:hypothetical protein